MTDDDYTHLVVTWDGERPRVYVDGVERRTADGEWSIETWSVDYRTWAFAGRVGSRPFDRESPLGRVSGYLATRRRHAITLGRPGTPTTAPVATLRARGLRVLRLPAGWALIYGSIGPL